MGMRNSARAALLAVPLALGFAAQPASAWGPRAHAAIDRAALAALPEDGPVFLRAQADFVAAMAILPDMWRGASEPFSKIEEDPNHGWFREQFAGIRPIPRSRYEFVIALYRERERIKARDPERAQRMNIRWTGTLPYAAMEAYDRLVAGLRQWRRLHAAGQETRFIEQALAFDVVRLGHYIGDGAMPLHVSVHHDGWQGDNPNGYTREASVHGRFESEYVDRIALTEQDIIPRIGQTGRQGGDLFDGVLAYLDQSGLSVERLYQLDKKGAFTNPADQDARTMIYDRTTAAATMLRDMLQRAWLESGSASKPVANPTETRHPHYNAETGSAPPPMDGAD